MILLGRFLGLLLVSGCGTSHGAPDAGGGGPTDAGISEDAGAPAETIELFGAVRSAEHGVSWPELAPLEGTRVCLVDPAPSICAVTDRSGNFDRSTSRLAASSCSSARRPEDRATSRSARGRPTATATSGSRFVPASRRASSRCVGRDPRASGAGSARLDEPEQGEAA